MAKVSPSVLSADFAKLGEDCRKVLDAGADMIHFDVMDGDFVDNISIGIPVLQCLKAALPDAYMDVHLMITDPLRYVKEFADAGADCISFHVEAASDILATIAAIDALQKDAGLVVNPNTPVESAFPYLDDLALVLVMGVVPGHGGQAFRPETLDKIRALRSECDRRGLSTDISVDGGVKLSTTAPQCVEAGATILVAGSAIFGADDIAAAGAEFKKI
ncbi:MAG: ribulose-phosphate 3-epimerase [Lachnospiraceae bacterium]|nr:ribulose-phosphate 3-epimerase [Lachnospiraceae bacterium]